ncbi:MAG: chromosomal replication initiator protein DnaA [Alphaproteobacteria bacterium]|nr:chromosomal replication initiator protein DnaA [Alphaproteobacteria bacterium]
MSTRGATRLSSGGADLSGAGAVFSTAAGDQAVRKDLGVGEIWRQAREALRAKLGEARFENWLAKLELVAEVDGEVLIAAGGELERDRVRSNFGHLVQQAWNDADPYGRLVAIEARERIAQDVLALAGSTTAEEDVAEEVDLSSEGGQPSVGTETDQTLDNFLVGDSNNIAFGLARRLALGASVAAHVVTIVGPHGVGKTHLLKGIEAALASSRGKGSVLYMSSEDFTIAFVEGVRKKDTSELRAKVRKAKVVLLDDFQFICSKPGTLVEFFSNLRAVVAGGGVVVLACDQSPASLETLDDRMRDEIQGGVIAHMDMPERNLRREIVRAKAEAVRSADEAFVFEDEWVDMLADRLPASGRALYGAVRNVYVGTVLAGQPVTRAAVEKAIQLQLGGFTTRPPKIDTIKDVTAKAYGVTKQDLESSCRKRQFAQPRQYAMYMCRMLTTCSYPQIGRMFGERDHTTVLFAYRKISKLVAGNTALSAELSELEQRILADPRNSR